MIRARHLEPVPLLSALFSSSPASLLIHRSAESLDRTESCQRPRKVSSRSYVELWPAEAVHYHRGSATGFHCHRDRSADFVTNLQTNKRSSPSSFFLLDLLPWFFWRFFCEAGCESGMTTAWRILHAGEGGRWCYGAGAGGFDLSLGLAC